MTILEAHNITAGYSAEVNILSDVNLLLESGQIVSVIGPNGAGKSTLLKTIFGILKPSSGSIRLKSEDITGLKPNKVAQKGMVLTEAQLAALERAKQEKQAHGEIETEHSGYLEAQDTFHIATLKAWDAFTSRLSSTPTRGWPSRNTTTARTLWLPAIYSTTR